MQKKVIRIFLSSLFSFCFFTIVFYSMANTHTLIFSASQAKTPQVKLTPTPSSPGLTGVQSGPTIAPTVTPTPPSAAPVATDLETLFTNYSNTYHVDKELLKKIARCESGFNTQAMNGIYSGMFQFANQTWVSVRTEMVLDPNPDLRKNAEESIKTAAYMLAHGQANAWANCK